MSQMTIQLGSHIRRLRQARGWSQEQLAEYADLSLSYIACWKRGEKVPRWTPQPNLRTLSASLWQSCSLSAGRRPRRTRRMPK